MKYGKRFYKSKSIIGILYRNAVLYKEGDMAKLTTEFTKLGINDNTLQSSSPIPLNSLVRKLLFT